MSLGRVTTDFFGASPVVPDVGAIATLTEVSVQVGGAAAIAAVTASRLGCRARFCGKVADDFLGRYMVEGLRDAGVDTAHVVTGNGRMSPFTFTALDDGEVCAYAAQGDACDLAPGDLRPGLLLESARALLIDGLSPRAQTAAAELARRQDVPVVLDADVLREGTGELIALADVFITSERLASEIAPRGELQDSLVELQQLGPRSVIITMGDAGSIGLHDDQLVRQPALEIREVDPSGAGAVYHGAFAAAMVNGDPFVRCMEFASVAAGLSVGELGSVAGIPERDDVLARLDG